MGVLGQSCPKTVHRFAGAVVVAVSVVVVERTFARTGQTLVALEG